MFSTSGFKIINRNPKSLSVATLRKNAYDGEQEYYIVTKEVGARQEERTQEEIHRSQKKAILLWALSR